MTGFWDILKEDVSNLNPFLEDVISFLLVTIKIRVRIESAFGEVVCQDSVVVNISHIIEYPEGAVEVVSI